MRRELKLIDESLPDVGVKKEYLDMVARFRRGELEPEELVSNTDVADGFIEYFSRCREVAEVRSTAHQNAAVGSEAAFSETRATRKRVAPKHFSPGALGGTNETSRAS